MGLSSEIASAAVAVLTAVAVGLVVDDFKEWLPRIVERLIDRAVARLPDQGCRERFSEEWRSHVADTPGHLCKVWVSVGFLRASRSIARASRGEPVWVATALDIVTSFGVRIVQRRLYLDLHKELAQQPNAVLCDMVLREMQRRFEPTLRKMLRSRLSRFREARQLADDLGTEFVRVGLDYVRELQENPRTPRHLSETGETDPSDSSRAES
jgi:hypothetical protein